MAKQVAEDWYLEMKGKARAGLLERDKTFAEAADEFSEEYEAVTKGHRSPKWMQGHKDRIRLHLLPYFGKKPLPEISAGVAQEYRAHRMTQPEGWDEEEKGLWNPPARNTIHNEIVTLSMILKTAHRHGWIGQVPDLSDPSDPYRRQSKVELVPAQARLHHHQETRNPAARGTSTPTLERGGCADCVFNVSDC